MNSDSISLLGYQVCSSPLEELALPEIKPCVFNTINPHSYILAKSDYNFSKALHASQILVPDGSGICLAASILKGRRIQKIAGADIFSFFMQRMEKQKGRVFFMGSSEKVLNLIEDRLSNQFPNITAGFFSPPYKAEFDVTDNQKILNEVNSFRPDVLFVGMTAPKQEKWVQEHKDKLDADVICSIGAVFDFYAGTVKRSGKIWIKIGLEWLPRLFREPRRLFTRNFVSTPLFLLDILLGKIGLKKWETP